jgi:hypothetical protein
LYFFTTSAGVQILGYASDVDLIGDGRVSDASDDSVASRINDDTNYFFVRRFSARVQINLWAERSVYSCNALGKNK